MNKPTEKIFRPNHTQRFPDWAEMWEHRDILRYLVKKEYVSKYKQTILGPVWFMLQPLIFAVVISFTFGSLLEIKASTPSPFLFYLAGMVGWNYFSLTFQTVSRCLSSQAELFKKVYFPRLLVPLSTMVSNLIATGFQLAVFFLFYAIFSLTTESTSGISPLILIVPFMIFHIGLISFGVGLILSSLTAKYRDFHNVMALLIQLLFFITPVIYPTEKASGFTQIVLAINPLSSPIEGLRSILLGSPNFSISYYSISLLISILFTLMGILLFQKTQQDFIDYV